MKINSTHKEFVRSELKKGRESKYLVKALIHQKLSKAQATNCVKKQMKGCKPHRLVTLEHKGAVLIED